MKKLKLIFYILSISLIFSACSKNNENTKPQDIHIKNETTNASNNDSFDETHTQNESTEESNTDTSETDETSHPRETETNDKSIDNTNDLNNNRDDDSVGQDNKNSETIGEDVETSLKMDKIIKDANTVKNHRPKPDINIDNPLSGVKFTESQKSEMRQGYKNESKQRKDYLKYLLKDRAGNQELLDEIRPTNNFYLKVAKRVNDMEKILIEYETQTNHTEKDMMNYARKITNSDLNEFAQLSYFYKLVDDLELRYDDKDYINPRTQGFNTTIEGLRDGQLVMYLNVTYDIITDQFKIGEQYLTDYGFTLRENLYAPSDGSNR